MSFSSKVFSLKISVVWEVAIVLFVSFFLLILSVLFPQKPWPSILVPLAFLYPPVIVIFLRKFDPGRYGLIFPKLKWKDFRILLAVIILCFFSYALGFHLWQTYTKNFSISLSSFPGLFTIVSYLTFQIFVVALPEEFFFRGYLQTRMGEISPLSQKKLVIWGASIQGGLWVLILSNSFFAIVHLIGSPNPFRLLTFFPGLLFAWLWAKSGQLWLAILFHALCNTLSFGLTSLYSP